ncbi:uncharacterized protein LOC135818104 [Sycon ciliatum]|uniref:uncharacterized protein LOC135818104 n=1 Tax=Sycon ciliatum TaxID=27933 RepID=UPI0031F6FA30
MVLPVAFVALSLLLRLGVGHAKTECLLTPNVGGRQPAEASKSDPLLRFDANKVPVLCGSTDDGQSHRELEVTVTVLDENCYFFYDADIIVVQANTAGHESRNCSAVMLTDNHNGDDGTFTFRTVVPGEYLDERFPHEPRPSVIQFSVLKQDTCHCFQGITTQFYFKDDPYRGKDPCKDCGSSSDTQMFDCTPFSSPSAPGGSPIKCSANLTVVRNASCDSDAPPQPQIRCRPDCMNGGTCVKSGQCVCAPGWVGALCEKRLDPEPVKCDKPEPTPCAEMGPFYRPAQPKRSPMCASDPNFNTSTVMKMKFTLRVQDDTDCTPLANMPVDLWHANSLGKYMDNDCRSAEVTDENGMLTVETVYPMNYTGRPHHIHIFVHNTSQCHDRLVIQGYFLGDPLRSPRKEACRACHSDDPRLSMECTTSGQLMECSYTATLQRYRERPGCAARPHTHMGRKRHRIPTVVH